MKELFDVHCHMVPGVDDGAADLEESLDAENAARGRGQEDYHHTALSAADV